MFTFNSLNQQIIYLSIHIIIGSKLSRQTSERERKRRLDRWIGYPFYNSNKIG